MERKNDNTNELRKERRALIGKIERRTGAISVLSVERWRMAERLRIVEAELKERNPKPARKEPLATPREIGGGNG